MPVTSERPASKHEALIASRLDQTRQRIRLLDLLAGAFGLAAATLAFVAALIVLDVAFHLADGTRQVFALFFLVAASAYLWLFIVRPLRRDINPHYAARKLEESAGPGRHHVVNWIDLQGEPLPGPFRAGLDKRAARDVTEADPERAISNRRAVAAGVAAGLMTLTVIGLFIALGPGPFTARFGRAFGRSAPVPARTQIEIVTPEGGDGFVTVGSPARVVVKLHGLQPRDGATLHVRHAADEQPKPRPMTQDAGGEWSATVGPLDVGTGFWYRVTAGDGTTPEHRISLRATPHLGGFLATYRYRPYVNRADRTRSARRLDDLRGTEVTLFAKPNREVREARLDFVGDDGKPDFVRGTVTPQGLRWVLVLDRPGKYRLSYEAVTGEKYEEPTPSDVLVQPDAAPAVRFTSPAKDTEMPANGEQVLTADVADDIGLAGIVLKRKVVGGAELPDVPYLPGKFGTAEFGTPRSVSYRDALRAEGQKPGTVIEYWLEARDGCDYRVPNVGRSETFKVTLTGPGDPQEQKKKQDDEKKKKDDHDKRQEDGAKQEKQKRDDDKNKEQGQEQADAAQREQGEQGMGQPKESDQPKDGDKETEQKADQVREAMNKKDGKAGAEKNGDGEGKEKKGDKGAGAKKEGQPKDGDKGDKGDQPGGMGKNEGEPGGMGKDKKPGEGKGPGEGMGEKPGEGKEGAPMPGEGSPGEGKEGPPNDAAKPDEKTTEGKPGADAKPDPKAKGKDPADGAPPMDKPGGMAGEQPGMGDGMMGEGMGGNKGGDGPPAGQGGEGKEGGPDMGAGEGKPGAMGGMAGMGGASDKPGEDGMAMEGGAGGKPGQAKEAGGQGGAGADQEQPAVREKPATARAMMMQLEQFRKVVGDDVLKDAKISREQFERFLRDYAELARRKQKDEDERDNAVLAKNGSAAATGRVGPAPTPGTPDALRGGGRPKPPPEYRDSFADFLRRLR